MIALLELETREKPLIGKGLYSQVYPSTKNPSLVYKTILSLDQLQQIKQNPDLLKSANIRMASENMKDLALTMKNYPQYFVPVVDIKDYYYVQKKADVTETKKLMFALDNAIELINKKFRINTDLINITNMSNPESVNKLYAAFKKYIDPKIYDLLKTAYNLTQRVKKILPDGQEAVDSHSGNFAVYEGKLKFIDF